MKFPYVIVNLLAFRDSVDDIYFLVFKCPCYAFGVFLFHFSISRCRI
uniref:Uncharacterized protein n=1 Tax=Arundo donax TaxID=35708 RepID=A0A0A8Z7T1_ARUDO